MSHIPEGDLALYALSPEAVPADQLAAVRQHVTLCGECQGTIDFFATAEEDLRDPDVWEQIAGSGTYASLMEYGARVAAEDEEAAVLLAPFFASPADAAWTTVETGRFRTGGVVRKLCAHAHAIHGSDPMAALTFTDAAMIGRPMGSELRSFGANWRRHPHMLAGARTAGRRARGAECERSGGRTHGSLRSTDACVCST